MSEALPRAAAVISTGATFLDADQSYVKRAMRCTTAKVWRRVINLRTASVPVVQRLTPYSKRRQRSYFSEQYCIESQLAMSVACYLVSTQKNLQNACWRGRASGHFTCVLALNV